MAIGRVTKIVHISTSRAVASVLLTPGRNEKGWGIVTDAAGREIYFSHEIVESRFGFDDLRRGWEVEFELESGPWLRASRVRPAANEDSRTNAGAALQPGRGDILQ